MDVMRIGTKRYDTEIKAIPDYPGLNLRALQELVGGYIEPCAPVQLREQGIELLANEEGLLKGLAPNENLYPFFVVGDLVAVGVVGEEFTSLTVDQAKYLIKWLSELDS